MSKIKTECIDIFAEEIWNKECPECHKEMSYKKKEYLLRSIRNNVICKDCSYKQRKKDPEIYQRLCPCCNKTIIYTRKSQLKKALENNTYCKECNWGKKLNIPIKEIIRINSIKDFKKDCPDCGKEQTYNNKNNFLKALNTNRQCKECYFKKKKLPIEEKKRRKKISDKKYREKNIEKLKIKDKEYRKEPENKENNRKYQQKYRQTSKRKIYFKKYIEEYSQRPGQKEKEKSRKKIYNKKRKNNIMLRIGDNISSSIGYHLKSNKLLKNRVHYEYLIVSTIQEIIEHLKKNFLPGMTIENYGRGGWVIDHIIPISFFNYTSIDDIEFKYCWAIDNLQPLWDRDNIKKNDKITLWGKEINARYMKRDYFDKIDSFHIDSSF